MAWDVMSGVTNMAWDVMSGVAKTAWDVLSGVANLCGMFCPGCKKMAWDVLSRDVLSGSPEIDMGRNCYGPKCPVTLFSSLGDNNFYEFMTLVKLLTYN